MALITQGPEVGKLPSGTSKTNWKFLLIVIILAVIVGGAVLWCSLKQEQSYQFPGGKKAQTSKEFTLNLNEEAKVVYEFNIGRSLRKEEFVLSLDSIDMSQARLKFNKHCFLGGSDDEEMVIGDRQACLVTEEGGAWFKLISVEPDKAKFEAYFKVGPPEPLGPFAPKEIIITKKETADWKTYRNEEYGFEIKYPSLLSLKECYFPFPNGICLGRIDVSWKCSGKPDFICKGQSIVLGVINSSFELNKLDEFIGDNAFLTPTRTKKVINGREIYLNSGGDAGQDWTIALVPIEKRVITLTFASSEENREIESDEKTIEDIEFIPRTYDQMLSTFKFIEEFCGTSTYGKCALDSDCVKDGCSSQICRSKGEEGVVTTCEYRDCYNAQSYGFDCKCLDKKCQWAK